MIAELEYAFSVGNKECFFDVLDRAVSLPLWDYEIVLDFADTICEQWYNEWLMGV